MARNKTLLPTNAIREIDGNVKAYQIEGETFGLPVRRNTAYRVGQNISRRNPPRKRKSR